MDSTISGKHILFIIDTLSGGGAEGVIVKIANRLVDARYKVGMVLFRKKGVFLNRVSPKINIFDLNSYSRWDAFAQVFRLRRVILNVRPEVLVSFLTDTNIITVLAMLFLKRKIKIIISERTNLRLNLLQVKKPFIRKMFLSYAYRRADKIIAVSGKIKDILIEDFKLSPANIEVISNPVDLEEVDNLRKEEIPNELYNKFNSDFTVIAVGRLCSMKRQDILLKAFSIVRKELNVRLLVLGEGMLLTNLKALAMNLGISEFVDFIGFQDNPYKWIARSDVFVFSSEYEGFPNVILEAMACQVPVISTDCPTGPGEIIQNGVDGILVPVNDSNALAAEIIKLLKSPDLRNRIAVAARKRVESFEVDKIVKQYENVINTA